jgi:hypothetical protein
MPSAPNMPVLDDVTGMQIEVVDHLAEQFDIDGA